MKSCCIFFCLLHSFALYAKDINVATDLWEGYSSKDGTGYYFAVLKRVFPEHSYSFHFMPYSRSIAMLDKQQVDLVFGASESDFENAYCSKYILEADKTDMLVLASFYRRYGSLNDLVGKHVVSHLGYDWADLLPEGTKYSEYSDLTQMIKLLKKGRVDAILDYRADIEALLAVAPNLADGLSIIESVLSYDSTFCFAATEKGAQLLIQFEQVIPSLIESGELHQIMMEQVDSDADYPY